MQPHKQKLSRKGIALGFCIVAVLLLGRVLSEIYPESEILSFLFGRSHFPITWMVVVIILIVWVGRGSKGKT